MSSSPEFFSSPPRPDQLPMRTGGGGGGFSSEGNEEAGAWS
jgi:hypothetical protein